MEICRIYLSGGMSALTFEEQSKWRKQIINNVKNNYYIEKNVKFFDPTDYYSFKEVKHKSEKEIMNFDLNAVRNSDLIIVNFNDPKSIGTAMELMLAKELHIPIIGLNEDKLEIHPWLIECVDRMCDDIGELIEYVVDFYLT